MMVEPTFQTGLQKIPIAWKYLGELAPNKIGKSFFVQRLDLHIKVTY